MKLLEQMSYRSDISWRPPARLMEEPSLGLWGVSFTWGGVDLSEKILENVRFFVEAALNESEITNPFGYEHSFSPLENALRAGCALANDVVYRLVNKSHLDSGAETALLAKRGREVVLLTVGQPHVFLIRGPHVLPVLNGFDHLPANFSSGAFLPGRLLGVEPTTYPHVRSFSYEAGDELLFLAHSFTPSAVMDHQKLGSGQVELRPLFQSIAREFPHCPFWIAKLKL